MNVKPDILIRELVLIRPRCIKGPTYPRELGTENEACGRRVRWQEYGVGQPVRGLLDSRLERNQLQVCSSNSIDKKSPRLGSTLALKSDRMPQLDLELAPGLGSSRGSWQFKRGRWRRFGIQGQWVQSQCGAVRGRCGACVRRSSRFFQTSGLGSIEHRDTHYPARARQLPAVSGPTPTSSHLIRALIDLVIRQTQALPIAKPVPPSMRD